MTSSTLKSSPFPPLAPKILLVSTKAYFSPSQTLDYLKALLNPSNGIAEVLDKLAPGILQLAFLPDFLTVFPSSELLIQHAKSTEPHSWPLLLGAQDCFWEPSLGPYTGETVPTSLRTLGCSIVELGHAERRQYFSETDESTAKKGAAVCACGTIPLVCVGERSAPPMDGLMSMFVGNALKEIAPQITSVLQSVPKDAPVILAYEPVWAIGAEKPAGVDYVGPVVQAMRDVVKRVSSRIGETRVVYGGSAGPGLWGKGELGEWVDGMFLGRFAHEISGLKAAVDEVVDNLHSST